MSDTASPRFTHDSRGSVFLGPYAGADREYDLYADGLPGREPTLLARYGNAPEAYLAGWPGESAALREAYSRVMAQGLAQLDWRGDGVWIGPGGVTEVVKERLLPPAERWRRALSTSGASATDLAFYPLRRTDWLLVAARPTSEHGSFSVVLIDMGERRATGPLSITDKGEGRRLMGLLLEGSDREAKEAAFALAGTTAWKPGLHVRLQSGELSPGVAEHLEQYEAELHAKRYVLEVELSHDKFGGLSASLDELGREVFLAGCRLTQRGVDISRHPPALRLSIDVQAPEALVETLREMVEGGDLPGPAPDALADAASQFLLSVTPRVLISRGCAVSALRLYGDDGGDTLLHSLGPQRAPRAGLAPRLGR